VTKRCADCGENERAENHGLLCHGCYHRNHKNGSLDAWTRMAGLPTVAAVDVSWHEDALCAETDPEAFFPEKGGSTREAKAICADCPVRAECLGYALATQQRFGIWGGASERDRRKLYALLDDDSEEASAA
jgi:hypothetical protein